MEAMLRLLISYKYFLLFPALIVEGPVVTIMSAFLSTSGGGLVFNVWNLLLVVIVADITGDTMYYAIGRYAKDFLISRYPGRFSLDPKRIEGLELYFKGHGAKTIVMGKISHGLGWPAMVAAGSAHMPYRKFITINAVVSTLKSCILISLGYYYGIYYEELLHSLGLAGLVITTLCLVLVIYWVIRSKRMKGI